MNQALDPLAIARQPSQRRSKDRFEAVLAESEKLLAESGLSGFSIPLLAERLGYTRGSVYAFFPTHYAILNELASRYLSELEKLFYARAGEFLKKPWREAVALVVDYAVDFHNSHPVARLLILGGAVTDDSYRAQEMTIKRLGDLARSIWVDKGIKLPKGPPDITTLATEIGTACFRRSFFEHGEITRPYRDAAVRAMLAFLTDYIERPAPAPARAARGRPR